jgi:hypothetical protein
MKQAQAVFAAHTTEVRFGEVRDLLKTQARSGATPSTTPGPGPRRDLGSKGHLKMSSLSNFSASR